MANFHPTATTYKQGAKTLKREFYTSGSIYQKEQQTIFYKNWNIIGRASAIPKPGDYFRVNIAGESLIIVRDSKGEINAIFNVCRHRGTQLCNTESGHYIKHIQCPYHAWTYSTDGALVDAPHMYEVKNFNKNKYGLFKAAVAEWEGFIFVNIDTKQVAFEKYWKPMLNRLKRFNLKNLIPGHKIHYDIKANWKLVFQNYNECLHCPSIHPELARVLPFDSTLNDLSEGAFLGGPMQIKPPNKSATITGQACGRLVSDNIPKNELTHAYYYSIMPNFLLSIQPDYVNYYIIKPVGVNRTMVDSEWLFHPETLKGKNNIKDAVEFWDVTNRQDWDIIERSQLGISSSRYIPGPYSPRESIPAAWDREYLMLMKR